MQGTHPHIKTKRLTLREINPEIIAYVFKNYNPAQLMQFFGCENERELEEQRLRFTRKYISNLQWSFKTWFLIENITGTVIGDAGFHLWSLPHKRAELGYGLKEDSYKKKGYMKEALEEIIRIGFEEMGLNRIEAFIGPDNIPSLHLIQGFHFKGEGYQVQRYIVDGKLTDLLAFGLLESEYRATKTDLNSKEALIRAFEAHTLPAKDWTHEAHLTTGLWYVFHDGYEKALCKIRSGIISYNLAVGGKNTPDSGYHETITLFWMWLLDQFVEHFGKDKEFEEVRKAFINSIYTSARVPLQFFSKAHLMSTAARGRWVEPDLQELDINKIV